jgi:hypothetical protein
MGADFLTRWCYVNNVCVSNSVLQLVTPFTAVFEKKFLVPGTRSPPFDPSDFRIRNSTIGTVRSNFSELSPIPVFLSSRFYNAHMLWHVIMDSLVPTYWTMTSFFSGLTNETWGQQYGDFINKTNRILLHDNFQWLGLSFLKALTDMQIENFGAHRNCYGNIVLGLRKSERTPILKRRRRDALVAPYEIDPVGVRGLRRVMLEFSGTTVEDCEPSVAAPVILVIQRRTASKIRRILNIDDLALATAELCPFCQVKFIELERLDSQQQIRAACNVSMLIGIHGSGLVHQAWMKPSTPENPTAGVEFFPYKYNCRTWYQQCANIFGIQHFAVHTLNRSQSRWETGHNMTKVNRCHTLAGECLRARCHDFLRDQSILVDIPDYKSIVRPYFESLKEARDKQR